MLSLTHGILFHFVHCRILNSTASCYAHMETQVLHFGSVSLTAVYLCGNVLSSTPHSQVHTSVNDIFTVLNLGQTRFTKFVYTSIPYIEDFLTQTFLRLDFEMSKLLFVRFCNDYVRYL